MSILFATARALVAVGMGSPVPDESVGIGNGRLAAIGSAQAEQFSRRYRELLVTTP